jgi:Na+-translocating ferredoxin:NAD+ oxidoreductase RnfG subunit
MKRWQFGLLMVLAVACLCLALVSIVFARQNQKLQTEVQAQQVIINKGALSQQIGANLLREMASAASGDAKMKQLLQENGYNAPANIAASPAP